MGSNAMTKTTNGPVFTCWSAGPLRVKRSGPRTPVGVEGLRACQWWCEREVNERGILGSFSVAEV